MSTPRGFTPSSEAVVEVANQNTGLTNEAVVEVETPTQPFPAYTGYKTSPARVINYLRATEKFGYGKGLKVFSMWRLQVLKGNPEEVFFPAYAERLNELQLPQGFDPQKVENLLGSIKEILNNHSITSSIQRSEAVFALLKQQDKEIQEAIFKTLYFQYGRGAFGPRTNYGWSDIYNMGPKELAQAFDFVGEHQVAEIMATCEAILCYNSITMQSNGHEHKLTLKQADGSEVDLVDSEYNPKTNKISFKISSAARSNPDLTDRAIHALADLISSHRQSNNSNVVTPEWDPDINISLRLCAVLLCEHHMHLNLTPDFIKKMDAATSLPGNEDQRALWENLKKSARTYSVTNSNQFFAPANDPALGLQTKSLTFNKADPNGNPIVSNTAQNHFKLDEQLHENIYNKSIFSTVAVTASAKHQARQSPVNPNAGQSTSLRPHI